MNLSKSTHAQQGLRLDIRWRALVAMMVGLALMRLLPHPPNFTPVASMALFAGARFERRLWAFCVPIGAMLLSDIAIELLFGEGFHALMPVVYASFVAVVALGFVLRRNGSMLRIAGMALSGSWLFFLSTNFAIWLTSDVYPRTLAGLATCFVAALPFFGNSVAGSLFYTGMSFAGWALAKRRWPVLGLGLPRAVGV